MIPLQKFQKSFRVMKIHYIVIINCILNKIDHLGCTTSYNRFQIVLYTATKEWLSESQKLPLGESKGWKVSAKLSRPVKCSGNYKEKRPVDDKSLSKEACNFKRFDFKRFFNNTCKTCNCSLTFKINIWTLGCKSINVQQIIKISYV